MTAALNLRDDLLETAERYETVAALDTTTPTSEPAGGRTPPGSRVPPGMQAVLDEDELTTTLAAVDDWARFLVQVLLDETDMPTAPHHTPARLRRAAEHAAHFTDHDDEMLALAVRDDARHHLRALRRLSKRGTRRVRTGMTCQRYGCDGPLVSPLGGPDRTSDALVCEVCAHEVPFSVWSSWPRARVQFVTVEHAARLCGTTVQAVKMRASRGKWRKVGTGRDVRYHVEDVRAAAGVEVGA